MTKGRAEEPAAYRLIVRFGAEIMEEGFTSVPNLVLNHYAALGITGAEMLFIIHVWQFWWSERENPHPSSRVLAERMGVDQRTVRNYSASLEAKGFLVTRERIIPGEGQRANVYDFAKLLKAVTKAAKMVGRGTGAGTLDPRKDPSAPARTDLSGGRRRNISAQRLKKLSGEGWKDDSGLKYVVSNELSDEDISNIRQLPTQQKRERGRPSKERPQPAGTSPEPSLTTMPLPPASSGEGRPRPPSCPAPHPPETPLRSRGRQGEMDHVPGPPDRETPHNEEGATAPAGDPAREELHGYAEVIAREFNDQAPFRATLSRIVNLYRRAELPLEEFTERIDAARQRTKERTGAIRMLAGEKAAHGLSAKNKMPYFFAIFEELLGLREPPPSPTSGAEEGETPARRKPDPATRDGGERRPPWRPHSRDGAPVAKPAPAPERPAGATPPSGTGEDARLIKGVISTFSRQFADCSAADGLGEWAVALWRCSRLSRERFLATAADASVQMLRDRTTSPSAARFQACLTEMLGRLDGNQDTDAQDRGEMPSLSAPAVDNVDMRHEDGE